MSVYVDCMKRRYGRMTMCHMVADTTEELLQMADAIAVDRKWVQHDGTYKEHFDICMRKRSAAVSLGAIVITRTELGQILRNKKKALEKGTDGADTPELT